MVFRTLRALVHSYLTFIFIMQPREKSKVRVLIADDHPMMLSGVRSVLSTQKRIEIIGEAHDGDQAIAMTKELLPDIILMDISMPGTGGLEASSILREEMPDVKVIILSMHDDREYILRFVKSGACGYVLKKAPPDELLRAIDSVSNGEAFLSPAIANALLKEQQQSSGKTSTGLTKREEQVLLLIAKGCSSKQIADRMYLSVRTVGKYRETIMQKLGIHSIAELTKYAIAMKLVDIEFFERR